MLLTPERSEETRTRIQAAIENALRDKNVSARRASLDVVGNDGLIRDIRAGRLPGVDRLEALFEYLGLEFYYGHRRRAAQGRSGFSEPEAEMSEGGREALRGGYLPIPWHDLSPRQEGQPAAPVAFSRNWIEASGLAPEQIAAVAPEFPPSKAGLVALVDQSAPRREGPALWCFREGGRVGLGRFQFEGGVTVLFAEEPDGKARILLGDDRAKITFLGRVVWSGQLHGPLAPL
jgi:hypothetical protein